MKVIKFRVIDRIIYSGAMPYKEENYLLWQSIIKSANSNKIKNLGNLLLQMDETTDEETEISVELEIDNNESN